MKVSFDFDDTLLRLDYDPEEMEFFAIGPNEEMFNVMRDHMKAGDEVYVVTSRRWSQESESEIKNLLQQENVLSNIKEIIHVGTNKYKTLDHMGIELHYDDDPYELALLPDHIKGIEVETIHGLE